MAIRKTVAGIRVSLTLAAGTLALAASMGACSGGIVPVGDGGTGGDSSVDGGDGGDGGSGCSIKSLALTRACVPGTAPANTPLTIEVDAEGCLGCTDTLQPCKVTVSGSQINVVLDAQSCPAEGIACPAICMLPHATCAIPALPAGSYTIELATGVRSSEDPIRRLVVTATGGASSCTIPPGTGSKPISAGEFPQGCSIDDDCAPVVEGNLCQPCACPTGAIAKTAKDAYDAEVRSRQSLCTTRGGTPSCAPCASRKATCSPAGKCALTL